jgi:hypothetical protein
VVRCRSRYCLTCDSNRPGRALRARSRLLSRQPVRQMFERMFQAGQKLDIRLRLRKPPSYCPVCGAWDSHEADCSKWKRERRKILRIQLAVLLFWIVIELLTEPHRFWKMLAILLPVILFFQGISYALRRRKSR